MKVMSLGVLSFIFLLTALLGYEFKEDNKLASKLICIDQGTTPKLFYLSFIEVGNLPRGYAYLDAENEIHSVLSSEQDVKNEYRISSIFCSSVDQFLLENEFDQVRLSLGSYSFLEDKNDEINRFVHDFNLLEEEKLLSFEKTQKLSKAHTESYKRNEKPASFDSFFEECLSDAPEFNHAVWRASCFMEMVSGLSLVGFDLVDSCNDHCATRSCFDGGARHGSLCIACSTGAAASNHCFFDVRRHFVRTRCDRPRIVVVDSTEHSSISFTVARVALPDAGVAGITFRRTFDSCVLFFAPIRRRCNHGRTRCGCH